MSFELVSAVLNRDGLIEKLFEIGAIQEGEFTFKSGIKSPIYIDLRRVISYPELLQLMADMMWTKISTKEFNSLCAVPYGALPLASSMAVLYQKPMIMARKDVKDHGILQQINGVYQEGTTVLLVEDIVTSGVSILETVETLSKVGIIVTDVVSFMEYEKGGKERLAKEGITLHEVCTISHVLDVLQTRGKIDEPTVQKIKSFVKESRF